MSYTLTKLLKMMHNTAMKSSSVCKNYEDSRFIKNQRNFAFT